LPEHIKIVVLAMDGDKVGKKAAEFMAERLTRAGIHVIACIPPDDGLGKDWNERWQKARGDSLAPVLDAYQSALALGREYDIQT
jgi:DNA primase